MEQTNEQASLIEYPCAFPIKVMGKAIPEFQSTITSLVLTHDPQFNPVTTEVHPSSKGNFVSLTFTIHATSREQLDNLYRALTGHPMVAMVF